MADVFLSYKRERRAAADHLAEIVRLHGFSVWRDDGQEEGGDLGVQIERELRAAKVVVVLWCSLSRDSAWVLQQAILAERLNILTPVRLEQVDPPIDFPRIHIFDLTNWSGAPLGAELLPLLQTVAERIGRLPQIDYQGVMALDARWRRLGAPPPQRFATLGAAPEPVLRLPSLELERLAKEHQAHQSRAADAAEAEVRAARAREAARMLAAMPSTGQHNSSPQPTPNRWEPLSTIRDPLTASPGSENFQPGQHDTLGPEMVVIPAGSFLMGSPPDELERGDCEGPQHRVRFAQHFALGRYPVTYEEYDRYAAATGADNPYDSGAGRGRHPVVNVSWEDAEGYCRWLSQHTGALYRLPSEAEWEYACRAGTASRWSFGGDEAQLKAHAWVSGNNGGRTHPVGEKQPNAWGLCDMHGNVCEWCADHWHDHYIGAPADGGAWIDPSATERVFRGGLWSGHVASAVRSAFRDKNGPHCFNSGLGFRCARSLKQPSR